MKTYNNLMLSMFFCWFGTTLFCQVKMGDNPQQINPNSIFEIESTNQGILIPRMTTRQRNTAFTEDIPNALLIFNSDTGCLEYYLSSENSWYCIKRNPNKENLNPVLKDSLLILGNDTVNLAPFLDNTDHQKLSLNGTLLQLENGGTVELEAVNSDKQQLKLSGTTLSIDRGGSVDLEPILKVIANPQQIDSLYLKNNVLHLSLKNDDNATKTVDLSTLNSDHQTLEIENNTLKIKRGNSLTLAPYLDNTDQQQLYLSKSDSETALLNIENGNSITLKGGNNIVFSLQDSRTLWVHSQAGGFSNSNQVTSNAFGDWEQDDFVFGSDRLANDKATRTDNKRFFFDKSKGAFRAGIAESDQWDDDNIGTYSIAMGRNPIASGYHATAFGSGTRSEGWYTTAMGNGTAAYSHSETVMGRYNTPYSPIGGARDWELSDRLFVIGNGTGNTKAKRSNALTMLKDGSTTVSGIWSGPGFTTLSDPKVKTKIKALKNALELLSQLRPKSYQHKKDASGRTHYGVLANELQEVLPDLVYKNSNEILSVNYTELIPLLIAALNELYAKIDRLE